ncbi:MAG: 50S ribosomal protein L23 [Rhodospirillaceae bacterium]|nr:50S ribosomal protein L23 [Rhodospirillaceae bacterium]|tara:strand:- start:3295 stop:3618 length:324 start_codon:yes stop_codon:yes gene_type:complete
MSARREKQLSVSEILAFELIRAPIVTEKSTLGSEHNQVTFKVRIDATKPQIKLAIEQLFKVKVVAVNTLRQRGKIKRFKGRIGRRSDYKKAIVSLADGESIDVTTGI